MVFGLKNCVILLFLLLVTVGTDAQNRRYYGRLVDKNDAGIPNAFIKVKNANLSFPCDSRGVFSFAANLSPDDSIVLYAPGYQRASIVVDVLPEDSIIVELKKNTNVLDEVTVGVNWGRTREAVAGSRRSLHQAGCYLLFKDEIAMFLPADSALKGLLKEVNVYITKDGMAHKNKFLIHVYRRDSATGAPGEEVTDTAIVAGARRGNEWVGADLGSRKIQVKDGLFVSVEWIFGYDNDGFPWPMHGETNYYAGEDSLRQFYNGQVLGLTWLNNVKPIVYRRYARTTFDKTAPGKWFLTPPTAGGCRHNECITPMMYYTYTYVEH